MNIWTGTATVISALLSLVTAAINLATAIQIRLRRSRNRQHNVGQQIDGR